MIAVIPSYNPDEHLYGVIKELHEETDAQLLVVDDGTSEDKKHFFDCLSKEDIFLSHDKNRGKGAAMKTALRYVYEHYKDKEAVVFIDGDGQHKIADIKRVMEASAQNPEKVIFGSRQFPKDIPWKSKIGNKMTTDFLILTTGKRLMDTQTGLRAIPGNMIKEFSEIIGERYEYEMNMLVYLLRTKTEIVELPIEAVYENNENKTTHFRPIKDTLRIHFIIFRPLLTALLTIAMEYVFFLLYFIMDRLQGDLTLVLHNAGLGAFFALFYFCINKENLYIRKPSKGLTILKYCAVIAGILAVLTGLLYVFAMILHLPLLLAKLIIDLLAFIICFWVQRIKIFH